MKNHYLGMLLNKALLILLATLFSLPNKTPLSAQELPLNEAYRLLEENYPNLRNTELNDKILSTELAILDLERKPTLQLMGSAALQSETIGFENTENLPISVDIPLYSARAYGEVSYNLYDGGRLEARKAIASAEGKLGNQELEVEKYGLRQRVNHLFLGVLLNRQRVTLFETSLADIAARKITVSSAVELGAALESEVLQLSVKEIEIEAKRDNTEGNISRLLASLSSLIGKNLSPDIQLQLPVLPPLETVSEVDRPELALFDLQRSSILANEKMIKAATKPMVSAFAQVGVGAPNPLNVFDSGVAPYALGGVNFKWQFKDWGKADKQRELLQLRATQLENKRQTFLFNLNSGNEAYLADLKRLEQQVVQDRRIADLQGEILSQLAAQLDNGVITATDYLAQVNAELLARQTLRVDETRLVELQLNFLNERGGIN